MFDLNLKDLNYNLSFLYITIVSDCKNTCTKLSEHIVSLFNCRTFKAYCLVIIFYIKVFT